MQVLYQQRKACKAAEQIDIEAQLGKKSEAR